MKVGNAFLETLEPRIAPALLVHGANLLGGGEDSTGETSLDGDSFTVVRVSGGQALVWFDASTQSITGVSLGHLSSVEIFGDVKGDIVTNLAANGRLSDSDNDPSNGEDGNILLANTITSLTIQKTQFEEGNVGNIIAGGGISRVSVGGSVSGIYAGNGVFDADSNAATGGVVAVTVGIPVDPSGTGPDGFVFQSLAAQATSGAAISNVTVGTGVNLQIIAGDGLTAGGAGGGISNVTISGATVSGVSTVSYLIKAGDGADGLSGGHGGSIAGVTESASTQTAIYRAGDGGQAVGVGALNGGNGGSISRVNAQSDQTNYEVTAGSGGDGPGAGGLGGGILQSTFVGRDPKTGVLVAGDFTGDSSDDVIVVDSGSGQMVLMENDGSGTNFLPVDQGGSNPFIPAVGVSPRSIQAADIDGDSDLDFVVLYTNSANFGVFLNNGSGVFSGTSYSAGVAPVDIALGNFFGDSAIDVAILASSASGTRISVAEGDGLGGFALLGTTIDLGRQRNAVDMVATAIDGNPLTDLFVGFGDGRIVPLLATGSNASLFQTGTTVTATSGGTAVSITNLDVSESAGQLLAFSSSNAAIAVFDVENSSITPTTFSPVLTGIAGQALVARFGGLADGNVQVLNVGTETSVVTEFAVGDESYSVGRSVTSTETLKTFVPLEGAGIVGLTGSLTRMVASDGGTEFSTVDLPFTGKAITLTAGDGGDGGRGNGGAGGAVTGLRAETSAIEIITGSGGNSQLAAGGAGGAFSGATGAPIKVDTSFVLSTGSGGTGGTNGGAGGSINTANVSLGTGSMADLITGSGGTGGSGAGGAGGSATGLTVTMQGDAFSLVLGDGGSSSGRLGGAGGAVTRFTLSQEFDDTAEALGDPVSVVVSTGDGGSAPAGTGGAGGAITTLKVTVDPSATTGSVGIDSTAAVSLQTGSGGAGSIGGTGGSLTGLQVSAILDERGTEPNTIALNFAVLEVIAGSGGAGSVGNGGAGGSVTGLQTKNLTGYDTFSVFLGDPGLVVLAGDGGDGNAAGGAGGRISNVSASNGLALGNVVRATWLMDAEIVAGDGGTGGSGVGGAGGSLTNIRVGVAAKEFIDQVLGDAVLFGGTITATAGSGGDSVASRGGAGGSVTGSVLAAAQVAAGLGAPVTSLEIRAGHGGNGLLAGGLGGAITTLNLQTPAQDARPVLDLPGATTPKQGNIYGAILVAGNGGNATSASDIRAIGGAGGNISGITQSKDINSFLSQLQAGRGGDSNAGIGGNGGSVTTVRTPGFIGRPFDASAARIGVFDDGLPQGVFAGLGGAGGVSDGLVGTVANIVARQISAIGAGADVAANTGLFTAARSVANVRADLIGYDVNNNGIFEGPGSPSGTVPVDGFIIGTTVSGIVTANPTRTAAFTFNS